MPLVAVAMPTAVATEERVFVHLLAEEYELANASASRPARFNLGTVCSMYATVHSRQQTSKLLSAHIQFEN